jgi:hypothetical protein
MRRVSSLLFPLLLAACGGPGSKTPTTTTGDAGAADAAPVSTVSTLPKDVRSPPPFHLGSKHATVQEHLEWGACHAGFHPSDDPVKGVAALGAACAAATKMHATGAPMTGSQHAISSAPTTYSFHAQRGHCYRLYGVAGKGVKSLVAVVTDAAGAEIAEYHTDDVAPFFAPNSAMCFSDDADVKIAVSVGIGDGPYALALWSE